MPVSSIASKLFPRAGRTASRPAAEESSNVPDAPGLPQNEIGPAEEHLYRELLELYWKAVKSELAHMVLTLKKWQETEYEKTLLADEQDDLIHGFDTFLDQVSDSSRQFARRYDEALRFQHTSKHPTYEGALRDRGWLLFANGRSSDIRAQIRNSLDGRLKLSILRRRARMLLQAGGFLDIDKVIEHKEQEGPLPFWKRPSIPQLAASQFDATHMPILTPQQCSDCTKAIRGSMFIKIQSRPTAFVCEDCYRKSHYGQPNYIKMYKHCILPKIINPKISQKLCQCNTVRRLNSDGSPRALFPVDGKDAHFNTSEKTRPRRCYLLKLPHSVAEAKYAAILSKVDNRTTLSEVKRAEQRTIRKYGKKPATDMQPGNTRDATAGGFGNSSGITDKTDEDLPVYLRSVADKYPYGNVHISLRIGPLVIENGAENARGGALITSRDPPSLQALRDPPEDAKQGLLLIGASERKLYTQNRPQGPRWYMAITKQVVGGAFCGFFNERLEETVIDALIAVSQHRVDPSLSDADKRSLFDQGVESVMENVRLYLSSRTEIYIKSVADKLLDPDIDLNWDFQTNNCQNFCDNLINQDMFGPLLAPDDAESMGQEDTVTPLYLMSFVCRPGAYVKETVESKYDVPNGLMEEYLLKFRFGWHNESDIIDDLAEYWYDWGAFGGVLYPYQNVFPWDCTEAYGRYPVKCSDCNISKHVWAFPFDSWSIVALHLTRGKYFYGAADPMQPQPMSNTSWMRNRLTVLLAQDVLLTAAAAMARSALFRKATEWLRHQPDARLDRLKLGGVHRAQPFSHHFEKGAHHQYFIAGWAHLKRQHQVASYELLRDWRVSQEDVSIRNTRKGTDQGGDNCGAGFGCGGLIGACAGGCSSGCGGGCGSGCAGACGGDGDGEEQE